MTDQVDDQTPEEDDFEAKVAALLKVDPEGITGQTSEATKAKKKADKRKKQP